MSYVPYRCPSCSKPATGVVCEVAFIGSIEFDKDGQESFPDGLTHKISEDDASLCVDAEGCIELRCDDCKSYWEAKYEPKCAALS